MESIFTKKVVYVLKSLYYLEVVRGNEMTSVVEIAAKLDVPKRFLEQLFLRLRKGGILDAVRGATGGYRLRVPLAEISYRHLLDVLEEHVPSADSEVGSFGEEAFVENLRRRVEALTGEINLGALVTEAMRRRAHAARAGDSYVYHI